MSVSAPFAWMLSVLVALSGCGTEREGRESPPEREVAPEPDGEPPAEVDPAPRSPEEVGFDFRRVLIDPATTVGSERVCIVASVHEGTLREGDTLPTATVLTKLVRCQHPHGAYAVLVGIGEGLETAPLAPFQRGSLYEAVPERHLRVRVVGVSRDGHTPLTVLLASREMPPSETEAARALRAARRGRCLGCDEPAGDAPELPVGLDFGRITREPELVGTRGSCAVFVANQIVREEARGIPVASLPEGVLLSMPVTCRHSGGRSSATLLFSSEIAEQVINVRRGAVAHGSVLPGARLFVAHVVPPTIPED